MRFSSLFGLILVLSLGAVSCAETMYARRADGGSSPAKSGGNGNDREGLERKLDIAKLRLSKAQLEGDHAEKRATVAVQAAKDALAVAEAKFATFKERDSPQRLNRALLDVSRSENRLADERAELAQLEMMYAETDLSTKTGEIVIDRQKRSLALAERNLELDRTALTTLEFSTLVHERRELELALIDKRSALERAEQEAEVTALSSQIEISGIEAELKKLEAELADLGGPNGGSQP